MKPIKTTSEYDRWEAGLRDRRAVARIRIRLDRLAMGNPGDHRMLKGGVSELRIDYGPGYRVYFTEREGTLVILLCGGTKKGQGKDIALAERLVKEIGHAD
jgi:putative addiction module killer protein